MPPIVEYVRPDGSVQYRATLLEMQCAARCRRRVALGLPFCWQHRRLLMGVRLGPTPDLGPRSLGLFACRHRTRDPPGKAVFEKGDPIAGYLPCETLTRNELYERHAYRSPDDGEVMFSTPYALSTNDPARFHDATRSRSLGSMVNDARGRCHPTTGKPLRNNAALRSWGSGGAPFVVATRRIRDGDEVLCGYGAGYWRRHFLPDGRPTLRARLRRSRKTKSHQS